MMVVFVVPLCVGEKANVLVFIITSVLVIRPIMNIIAIAFVFVVVVVVIFLADRSHLLGWIEIW